MQNRTSMVKYVKKGLKCKTRKTKNNEGVITMKKIKLIGKREFETRKEKNFIVYYYISVNALKNTYGIRLEKKVLGQEGSYEYEEEEAVTDCLEVAEELANYLMDYEVTPISLVESLDVLLEKKDRKDKGK